MKTTKLLSNLMQKNSAYIFLFNYNFWNVIVKGVLIHFCKISLYLQILFLASTVLAYFQNAAMKIGSSENLP